MLVARFSIHDKGPEIRKPVPGNHKWKIDLYLQKPGDRTTKTIINKQLTPLSNLLEFAIDEVHEMMNETPDYEDVGFAIHLLR